LPSSRRGAHAGPQGLGRGAAARRTQTGESRRAARAPRAALGAGSPESQPLPLSGEASLLAVAPSGELAVLLLAPDRVHNCSASRARPAATFVLGGDELSLSSYRNARRLLVTK